MTPEAAKLIREKFASRAEWRRHVKEANKPPRKMGSAKPFHRVNTLVEVVVEAQAAVQNLIETQKPGLLAKLVGKVGPTPQQVKAIGDAQIAVVRARDALAGYRSRGHGWTLSYGRMV